MKQKRRRLESWWRMKKDCCSPCFFFNYDLNLTHSPFSIQKGTRSLIKRTSVSIEDWLGIKKQGFIKRLKWCVFRFAHMTCIDPQTEFLKLHRVVWQQQQQQRKEIERAFFFSLYPFFCLKRKRDLNKGRCLKKQTCVWGWTNEEGNRL